MVDVLSKVSPEMMRQAEEEDLEISKVMCYVKLARKPSLAQIRKLKSKIVHRYLWQFDWLFFIKGVLHRVYEENGSKYHQLVLPIEYRAQAMGMLHDENGHQVVEGTVVLVWETFYWGTMLYNIQDWVKKCQHLKPAKGPYTDPEPPQGSIVANNPMDMLLVDFMKLDPSKNGKKNVLVMMDAFSKICIEVITPNQKAKMIAKALVDKWFYTYGIPAHIHSNQGKNFDNHLIEQLCRLYGIQQSTTTPYNPQGNYPFEHLNCRICLKHCQKMRNPIGPNSCILWCLHIMWLYIQPLGISPTN